VSADLRGSDARGAALALLAFAIYSTHDVVVKFLGGDYSPFQLLFFSTLFGFPVVTIMLMRDARDANLRPRHPWWMALRTATALLTGAAAFTAFSTLPLAQTYAIIFAAPLIITILAIPMLGERVGWRRSLAVAVGLGGVIVVLQPGATDFRLGHLAALTAAVFSALGAVITRKIGGEERSAVMLLYPMMANFIVMGCALPFVYREMPGLDLGGMALMAVLGFVGGICLLAAYRLGRAVIIAPMQYSQLIWATLYGALFFGERPEWNTALGAAIVIASGIYIVFREDTPDVSNTRPLLRSHTRFSVGTAPRVGVLNRILRRGPRPDA
jgi:drug/metabolite transporter (DMT)-like permease